MRSKVHLEGYDSKRTQYTVVSIHRDSSPVLLPRARENRYDPHLTNVDRATTTYVCLMKLAGIFPSQEQQHIHDINRVARRGAVVVSDLSCDKRGTEEESYITEL